MQRSAKKLEVAELSDLESVAAENTSWDGCEPIVIEQETTYSRQDTVYCDDLVVRRVEQLECRKSGQFHRHVREVVVGD